MTSFSLLSANGGGGLVAEGLPPPPPSSPPPMCVSPIPSGQMTPKASNSGGKLVGKSSVQSVLAERYVLGNELGRGAHGHVYQAMDKKSGQFVAVKQISLAGVSKENLTSVVGEIELLKDLNHKHIVQYFDSIKTRNHLYIVLEYMENGSLASVIKPSNFGTFSEDLCSVYIAQVLEGLKYLHSQGVVHRDVKGANILTTKEGLVKLADFGVAAKLQDKNTAQSGQKAHHNTVAGTPYWMAPEVIELTSVTPAADIWSVGCLVIELLTGTPPYFDCQPIQALYRIVSDDCPPMPHPISPYLEDFLRGCFKKEPSQRWTADQLLEHYWITHHQRSLKASWSRNKGLKKGNERSRASVSAVIENILQHQARASYSQDQDQVPTPEIAESPIGIFRTGSAPVSPGAHDLSVQTPMQGNEDPLVQSPSSHYPLPPKGWNHEDPIEQEGKLVGNLENSPRTTQGGISQQGTGEEVVEEFDDIDNQPNGGDEALRSHWLGPELQAAREKQVPVATVVFSQHMRGEESNVQGGRVLDPLSSAALYNTVGSQWNMHFDTMKSMHRLGQHDTERMEQLKMRKLVNNLSGHLRATDIENSARNLVVLIRSAPEKKALFFAEGGIVGVMELLYSSHHKVIEMALELVVVLCERDVKTLQNLCAVGIAPAVFRYSSAAFPISIRKHAASFMEMMCFTSISTLELFIMCQGIHWVSSLLEEGYKDSTLLTSIGLSLVEQIIKSHTSQVSNSLCRLFAATNLPHRLVTSLVGMVQMLKENHNLGSPIVGSDGGPHSQSFGALPNGDASYDPLANPEVVNHESHGGHSASGSSVSNPSTVGFSEGPLTNRAHCAPLSLNQLADRASSLLLMLSARDTIVRSHLCPQDTLKKLLEEVQTLSSHSALQFKIVKALKNVSCDPELLDRLQEAEAIEHLVPLLDKDRKLEVRREVLQLMLNLCKMNPQRREIAARSGIVPHLYRLASQPRQPENARNEKERKVQATMRRMAVEILCTMLMISTAEIRATLWKHDVLDLLLTIVNEEQWQSKVLDALAAWLEDDIHQVEPKLVLGESVQLLISILQDYLQKTNEVSQVLEPILRMLERSDKLSRQMGQWGLAPVIVEMLRLGDAATCLKLLRALTRIYAMHLRPKEFIKKYDVQRHLHRLAGAQPDQGGEVRILVRKHASDLLRAFQMNQIW